MSGGWTPGPWWVSAGEEITAEGGRNLADVWTEFAQVTKREAIANAHLIAAAPDMADVLAYYADQLCEGFCSDLPESGTYHSDMDLDCSGCRARAALAEARGEAK